MLLISKKNNHELNIQPNFFTPAMRQLLNLPNELLYAIGESIEEVPDLNSFAQTNKRLYSLLWEYLYRSTAGWDAPRPPAIIWAALHGQEETARKALDNDGVAGARYGGALLLAVENGHSAIARLLLERSAFTPSDQRPVKAAILRGHVSVVRMLLDNGFDPNYRHLGRRGHESALQLAARSGQEAVVMLLLDVEGIDKRCHNGQGSTPLCDAVECGYESIVRILLNTDGYNPTFDELMEHPSPVMYACHRGTEGMVKMILDKAGFGLSYREKWGTKLLGEAARSANVDVVRFLLSLDGVDPNGKNEDGWTPLFRAVSCRRSESKRKEVIRLLLGQKGVNPNAMDFIGRTPLWMAAKCGSADAIRILLDDQRISPDIESSYGLTALGVAVLKGHKYAVKALLGNKRINPNIKCSQGRTPLSFAAQRGDEDMVRWLLARRDLDSVSPDNDGRTPLEYALKDYNSQTPRWHDQSEERKAVVELLRAYDHRTGNNLTQ